MDKGYIVWWHSDLVNTKKSLLPVCDITLSQDQKKSTELGGAWTFVELCIRSVSSSIPEKI